MQHDDEPVFIRSRWGTSRYVYNHRNPVGLALIVLTVLFVGTMMILMTNRAGPFAPSPAPTPRTPPPFDPRPAAPAEPAPWPPLPPTGSPGP